MNCPRCQLYIADPSEAFCPRCGLALQPPQADTPTTASGGTETSYAPPMYPGPLSHPMPSGSFPSYGAPPSGSLYGGGMPPSYPPYPAYPPYGVAAPSTTPLNMQPSWVSPMPPIPVAKRRNGALIGLLVALLVAVVAGSGVLVYLVASGQHGQSGSQGLAGATATTLTASSYNPVFQDPLTSNTNGWTDDSYCHFGSDGYHVTNRISYAPAGTFTDSALSVQTTQVSGINTEFYGVVFRRVSTGNYYAFQIDSNGKWRVIKVANNHGSELVPYVPNAALHQGLRVKNTLEVRASGTHFEFYVNGTNVGRVDDATYASGKCGFEVYQGIEVAYTDLTISVPSS